MVTGQPANDPAGLARNRLPAGQDGFYNVSYYQLQTNQLVGMTFATWHLVSPLKVFLMGFGLW